MPEQMMAVGDSENDTCMIKLAGIGVAFCSRTKELLDSASHVIAVKSFKPLLEIF